MYPDSPPLHATTLQDLCLTRFQWGVEVEHWEYNSGSSTRCTGEDDEVDCSGAGIACSNYALTSLKLPPVPCQASWEMARACFAAPRPKWMQDHFGADPYTGSMIVGTGISAAQANVTPCAGGFHGPRFGQDGFGNKGHFKFKWYLNDGAHSPGASIEAMGVHAGVGFSVFLDPNCTYFAVLPWLAQLGSWFPSAPPVLESDMQVFIPPNAKVDANANTEHAEFWPAGTNPFLPNGGIVCKWGCRIHGDQGSKNPADPKQRVLVPGPGRKWIGCAARDDRSGLMVVNDLGDTSGAASLLWL